MAWHECHLDAMISQLRDAGIDVDTHTQSHPNGRFADLTDPEGNPIQLWESAGADRVPDDANG